MQMKGQASRTRRGTNTVLTARALQPGATRLVLTLPRGFRIRLALSFRSSPAVDGLLRPRSKLLHVVDPRVHQEVDSLDLRQSHDEIPPELFVDLAKMSDQRIPRLLTQ